MTMLVMENINLYGNAKSVAAVTLHNFLSLSAVLTTALSCVSFVQVEDLNYGPCSKTSDLRPFSGVGYYASLNKFCNGIAFQCCCVVGNWFLLYSKRSCHIVYFSTVKHSLRTWHDQIKFNTRFRFVRFVYVYFSLPGYDLVSCGRWLPTFHRNTLYHLQASISKKGTKLSPRNYCNTK